MMVMKEHGILNSNNENKNRELRSLGQELDSSTPWKQFFKWIALISRSLDLTSKSWLRKWMFNLRKKKNRQNEILYENKS